MEIEQLDAIRYERNFLKQVIFRLDFPSILAIHNPPAQFQGELRHDFPFLRQEITEIKIDESKRVERVVWKFYSRDERKIVFLSPEYVAVEYHGCYETFEEFRGVVDRVLHAFVSAYDRVSLVTRIGLRYINEIELREGTALEWDGLINPALLCHLTGFRPPGTRYSQIISQVVELREGYNLSFTYGLPNSNEYPGEIIRKAFLLDFDCFQNAVDTDPNIPEIINTYHHAIQDLFESSLEQGLRDILNGGN